MTSSAKIYLGMIFTNDSTEYVCRCLPWGSNYGEWYGATLHATDKNAQVHMAINGWDI
jgi:hypothetical protein